MPTCYYGNPCLFSELISIRNFEVEFMVVMNAALGAKSRMNGGLQGCIPKFYISWGGIYFLVVVIIVLVAKCLSKNLSSITGTMPLYRNCFLDSYPETVII